jgi:hypothetical protein
MGRPPASSFAFALAALLLFLAYEPLAVLLGIRGTRAQRLERSAAVRRLAGLLPAGLILGVLALFTAPAAGRWLLLLPLGCGLVLVLLVVTRQAKSLLGEVVIAAAFSSLHVPVGYPGGLRGPALWGPAVLWFVVFLLSTLVVHAIKDRQAGRKSALIAVADGAAMTFLLAGIVLAAKPTGLRWLALAALVPLAAVVVVNFGRITARHLKRIGWTLVASDLVALVVMTLAR